MQSAVAMDDEELLRAQFHGLLATLLAAPPSPELLDRLGSLEDDGTLLGGALGALGGAARATDAAAVEDEFSRLFIGVSGGELTPYASWYRTGFLNDKPLAALRDDLAGLGIAPDPARPEPEDHVAALLETMQGLITGRFGAPLPLERQKAFFTAHLAGWAPQFFKDLEAAEAASFYRPVGAVGRVFLSIEAEAFGMV